MDRKYLKKLAKIQYDNTKHYPNKKEAKLLRKLKSETGLSEEEIRENKVYRKQLSEAQKNVEKGWNNKILRFCRNITKTVCKKTGLAKEHPETLKQIEIELSTISRWRIPIELYFMKLSAKKIVELSSPK